MEDVEQDVALQLLGLSELPDPVGKSRMIHFTSYHFILLRFISVQFTSDIIVNKRGRPVVTPEAATEGTLKKAYGQLNRAVKDGVLFCTFSSYTYSCLFNLFLNVLSLVVEFPYFSLEKVPKF